METKASNPKDQVGVRKVPLHTVPPNVLMEIGLAMLEGAKYGTYNYRSVGVQGSIYYDAAMRHLMAWWNGEDIDPDSGLPHLAKATASLVVLRDGIINKKFTDDRPPALPSGWIQELNLKAGTLLDRIKDQIKPAFTEQSHPSGNK